MLERLPDGRLGAPVAAVVQLALVSVASRVAGTRPTVLAAAAVALTATGLAVALALAASLDAPRDRAACE